MHFFSLVSAVVHWALRENELCKEAKKLVLHWNNLASQLFSFVIRWIWLQLKSLSRPHRRDEHLRDQLFCDVEKKLQLLAKACVRMCVSFRPVYQFLMSLHVKCKHIDALAHTLYMHRSVSLSPYVCVFVCCKSIMLSAYNRHTDHAY